MSLQPNQLHPAVHSALLQADWTPARQVPVDLELKRRLAEQACPDHPALAALAQLGGLQVGDCGAGAECATSDLHFVWLADCETDDEVETLRAGVWQQLLHTRLVGIAHVHRGHADLLMASDGRCFGMSQVHDAFWLEGMNLAEALQNFVLGLRCRPMLRPDEVEVEMWGERFSRGHPLVYDFESE